MYKLCPLSVSRRCGIGIATVLVHSRSTVFLMFRCAFCHALFAIKEWWWWWWVCLLCSVDIFIAYAMSLFSSSIFMINNDLYCVTIILWLVCDNVVSTARFSLLKLVKFSFLFFSYLLLVLPLQWIKIIIFLEQDVQTQWCCLRRPQFVTLTMTISLSTNSGTVLGFW